MTLGFVSIKLYPSANLGFTWDAENNTTANISSVELGEVLGQPDSLKPFTSAMAMNGLFPKIMA